MSKRIYLDIPDTDFDRLSRSGAAYGGSAGDFLYWLYLGARQAERSEGLAREGVGVSLGLPD